MSSSDQSVDLLEFGISSGSPYYQPGPAGPAGVREVSEPLIGAVLPVQLNKLCCAKTTLDHNVGGVWDEASTASNIKQKQNEIMDSKKRRHYEGAVNTQDIIKEAKISFWKSQESQDNSICSPGTLVSSNRSTDHTTDCEVNISVQDNNLTYPLLLTSKPLAQSSPELGTEDFFPPSTTLLLELQWRKQVEGNVEIQEVVDRHGVTQEISRGLEEQVRDAKRREGELEEYCREVEETLRPPLLVLNIKLGRGERVEEELVRECLVCHPWMDVIKILRHQVEEVEQEREKLVRLLDSLLRVVTLLGEEGREEVLDLVRKLVRRLEGTDISWNSMEMWEREAVRRLVAGVQGIPKFLRVVLDQLLRSRRDLGVQTDTQGKKNLP